MYRCPAVGGFRPHWSRCEVRSSVQGGDGFPIRWAAGVPKYWDWANALRARPRDDAGECHAVRIG
jgi:hypothetical protein